MIDQLVENLKSATVSEHPDKPLDRTIVSLLTDFVQHLKTDITARPKFEEDDVILFEDDKISIWFCRFHPGTKIPPHNHNMTAIIGVYAGTEGNALYKKDKDERLTCYQINNVHAGEVLCIAPDAIHGVTCLSDHPSEAIHVYLGAITRVERNLYDLEHGEVLPYTEENYENLSKTLN